MPIVFAGELKIATGFCLHIAVSCWFLESYLAIFIISLLFTLIKGQVLWMWWRNKNPNTHKTKELALIVGLKSAGMEKQPFW